MALTLGITGMDSQTEAEMQAAFRAANAETGHKWTLVGDNDADYVVIDMDSLYGPMSWLRLHAAGRKVIGLTSVDRNQTDYRLPRPISGSDLAVLLSEIAGDTPAAAAPEPPPAAVVSIPAPADIPPPPAARAPPPSQARAALVAAAPLSVAIAVPVEAVPKVVAIASAAVGANAATPAPTATPAAAVPLPT